MEIGIYLAELLGRRERPIGSRIQPQDVVEFLPDTAIPYSPTHWGKVIGVSVDKNGLEETLVVLEPTYPNKPPKVVPISAASVVKAYQPNLN